MLKEEEISEAPGSFTVSKVLEAFTLFDHDNNDEARVEICQNNNHMKQD